MDGEAPLSQEGQAGKAIAQAMLHHRARDPVRLVTARPRAQKPLGIHVIDKQAFVHQPYFTQGLHRNETPRGYQEIRPDMLESTPAVAKDLLEPQRAESHEERA